MARAPRVGGAAPIAASHTVGCSRAPEVPAARFRSGSAGRRSSSGRTGRRGRRGRRSAGRARPRGRRRRRNAGSSRARRRRGGSRASEDPPASIASRSTARTAATIASASASVTSRGRSQRRDAGAPERLADVDVAEARDHALVEEHGLDRGDAAGEARGEVAGVEAVAERLGAEAGEQAVGLERGGRPEVDGAEAAGVVQRDPGAAVEVEDQVVVLLGRRVRVVEGADLGAGDQDAAGHAEVDDQRLAAVEGGEQVLRAAAERLDPRALQPLGQPVGERPAQVGAAHVGAGDDVADEHGLEAPAHGLDLGQLGQRRRLLAVRAARLRPARGAL